MRYNANHGGGGSGEHRLEKVKDNIGEFVFKEREGANANAGDVVLDPVLEVLGNGNLEPPLSAPGTSSARDTPPDLKTLM